VKESRGLRVVPNEVVEAGLEVLLTMDVKVLLGSHLYVALKPQNALREGDGAMKAKSLVIKRSIVIDGHKTSVSLEDEFWKALRDIAHRRQHTLSRLISSIDRDRQFANLSSALRLFVLEFYKDKSAGQHEISQRREITIQ
jgi:predicted DNA-binding ribbon-helix-helix protein